MYNALVELISMLAGNHIPACVVIAHSYVVGLEFRRERRWAMPVVRTTEEWFRVGFDVIGGLERFLRRHNVNVQAAEPAPLSPLSPQLMDARLT